MLSPRKLNSHPPFSQPRTLGNPEENTPKRTHREVCISTIFPDSVLQSAAPRNSVQHRLNPLCGAAREGQRRADRNHSADHVREGNHRNPRGGEETSYDSRDCVHTSARHHACCKNPQNKKITCFWVSQEKDSMELDFAGEDVN